MGTNAVVRNRVVALWVLRPAAARGDEPGHGATPRDHAHDVQVATSTDGFAPRPSDALARATPVVATLAITRCSNHTSRGGKGIRRTNTK